MSRPILHPTFGWIDPVAYSRKPPPGDRNRREPANKEGICDTFSKDRPVLLVRNQPEIPLKDEYE